MGVVALGVAALGVLTLVFSGLFSLRGVFLGVSFLGVSILAFLAGVFSFSAARLGEGLVNVTVTDESKQ